MKTSNTISNLNRHEPMGTPRETVQPIAVYLNKGATQKDADACNKFIFSEDPAELQTVLASDGGDLLESLRGATAVLYSLHRLHDAGIELGQSKIMDAVNLALGTLETADNSFACALESVGAIQYKVYA
jgi:hypothetical protein